MEYDLLIRGGRVADGSGLPSHTADVGVKDGKIADVGRLKGSADRTNRRRRPGGVAGVHRPSQPTWTRRSSGIPTGTSEPQHGITSIVMGNCGLALAPVDDGGEDALVKSFVRVEAIPRFALEKGVTWRWHSYGEYLDAPWRASSASTPAAWWGTSRCGRTSWARSRWSARPRPRRSRR